jgi:hypothetical protein
MIPPVSAPNDPAVGGEPPPGDPAPQPKPVTVKGKATVHIGAPTLTAKGVVTRWEVENPWWVVAVLIAVALAGPGLSGWVGHRVPGLGQWAIGAAVGLAGILVAYTVGKPKAVRKEYPPRKL